VSSTNNDAIYIKGGNLAATTDAAYNSYLVLPSDKYFCGYYSFPQISLNAIYNFTITFWINVKKPLATNKIARVIEFSDTAAKKYGIGIYLKQGDNSANTAVTLEVIYTSESSRSTDVQTVSDIGAGFATGWNHVAITFGAYFPISKYFTVIYYNGATSGIKQAGRISYIPVECLNFTSNFIGKSAKPDLNDVNLDAYLNDVKLYNITLSSDQVLAKYDAEKSKLFIYIYFKNLFIFYS
jgi:hypothetical protein